MRFMTFTLGVSSFWRPGYKAAVADGTLSKA